QLGRSQAAAESSLLAEPTRTRLLHSLSQRARALRTGFWLRSAGVAALPLILLGALAVGSQFDRERAVGSALHPLDAGRRVPRSCLARATRGVVGGDQELYEGKKGRLRFSSGHPKRVRRKKGAPGPPQNQILVIPDSEVLELQVRNPTVVGVPLRVVE